MQLVEDTGVRSADIAPAGIYLGPERRRHARPDSRWLALMIEEAGHGMVLLSDQGFVLHANQLARLQVEGGMHPLQIGGRRLAPAGGSDAGGWQQALDAARRGLRRLVMLGDGASRTFVAVVPMTALDGHRMTLVKLARSKIGDPVTLQCFAAGHGLTAAETRVLECLCQGLDPSAIAIRHEVGIATVRTQIGSVRHKVGAGDITALLRLVAGLPPMASVLRSGVATLQ